MVHGIRSNRKKIITLVAAGLFVLLIGAIFVWLGDPILRLASEPELLRQWVDNKGFWGRIIFFLILVLQVFAAVIPGEPLEIAAGYAFGALEGSLLCILGETAGGMLVFFFVRKFGVRAVEVFFSVEKIRSLRFLKNPKKRDALFLILFILPGTPKDLLCYFGGLTGIPAGTWLCIQFIGRLPSILTSTMGGNALGEEKYLTAVLVLAITAICSGIGFLLYRQITGKENRKHDKK